MFTLVFMMSVFALTGCGGGNSTDQATQSTSQDSGQGGSQNGSGSGTEQSGSTQNGGSGYGQGGSQNGSSMEESSTGVIDGMMDDVENGVNDLLDNPTESNHSDESK